VDGFGAVSAAGRDRLFDVKNYFVILSDGSSIRFLCYTPEEALDLAESVWDMPPDNMIAVVSDGGAWFKGPHGIVGFIGEQHRESVSK
jgi:hypothetical protein